MDCYSGKRKPSWKDVKKRRGETKFSTAKTLVHLEFIVANLMLTKEVLTGRFNLLDKYST